MTSCPWEDELIEDTRGVIIRLLDPLSQLMLRWTCTRNRARVPAPTVNFPRLLLAHGTAPLLESYAPFLMPIKHKSAVAAEHGNIVALNWLVSHKCVLNEKTFASAGTSRSTMEWLLARGCRYDEEETANALIVVGDLANLQWWLRDHYRRPFIDFYHRRHMLTAAEHGQLEILQWLHSVQKTDSAERLLFYAMRGAHFDIITWLRATYGLPWPSDAEKEYIQYHWTLLCKVSVSDIINWLRDQGCPLDFTS